MTESTPDEPSVDRRTLLRTGAWSAPVVAAAIAAPLAAATTTPTWPTIPSGYLTVRNYGLTASSYSVVWNGGYVRSSFPGPEPTTTSRCSPVRSA